MNQTTRRAYDSGRLPKIMPAQIFDSESEWVHSTIDETCIVEYGTRVTRKRDAGTIYPVYGGGGATFQMDSYNREDRMVVSRFAMSETCTRFVEGKFFLNDSGLTLRPKDEHAILPIFLDWLIHSLNDEIYSLGRGTAQKNLNMDEFRKLSIQYPKNISEQQRIVRILDAAFQNIEHCITQVTTKIQSAEEIFQSTLYSVFSEKGETWVDTTIGDEVDFLAGFAFKSAQYTDEQNGIKLLRGDNIIQGKMRWDGVKRWPKDEYEDYVKFALQEHDVVLAMDRPWVSAGLKFSSISQDDLPCLQVQRTARMRAGENLHWRFLFYLIGSHNFIQEMLGGQTGIGVPHISGKQIQSFSFARPPIKDQIAIAELLDSLSTNMQLLKENSQFELDNYSELRQSILQEAFNGTL